MNEREPLIVGGLVVLLLVLWLGFPLHESDRFAGSLWGGVFAVSGSTLMLVALGYSVVKRIEPLKHWVTQYVSMRTLLAWHAYIGVLGPILVLIHTGHKFESFLGVALTATVLFVVVSGFVVRYLMSKINREIKEKWAMLKEAEAQYESALEELRARPEEASLALPFRSALVRLFLRTDDDTNTPLPAGIRVVRMAESVADLEYAVRTHQTFKRAFAKWLKLHIAASMVLFVLLGLHIWASIHFGIRWFS